MNYKKNILGFVFLFLVLLSVNFVSAQFTPDASVPSSEATTLFNAGGAPRCIIDEAGASFWELFVEGETTHIVTSQDDCYRENGISGFLGTSYRMCCPENFACLKSTDDHSKSVCVSHDPFINSCSDYPDEALCNGGNTLNIQDSIYADLVSMLDSPALPITLVDIEGMCNGSKSFRIGEDTDNCVDLMGPCSCSWDSARNVCSASYGGQDCNASIIPDVIFQNCTLSPVSVDNQCDSNGKFTVSWTGVLTKTVNFGEPIILPDSIWCKDGSRISDCAQSGEGLPFFNMFNLIITGLAIVGIYFVWARKE